MTTATTQNIKIDNVCIIDRSNPHTHIVFDPKKPEGQRDISRIQEVRDKIFQHKYLGRTDCALINTKLDCDCGRDCCSGTKDQQFAIEFNPDGTLDGRADLLSEDQKKQLDNIYQKIVAAEKEFPEMGVFIGKNV